MSSIVPGDSSGHGARSIVLLSGRQLRDSGVGLEGQAPIEAADQLLAREGLVDDAKTYALEIELRPAGAGDCPHCRGTRWVSVEVIEAGRTVRVQAVPCVLCPDRLPAPGSEPS